MGRKTLFEHFGETPEWRRVTGNFRHDMREVLTVAFLAQAGGARSVRQVAVWAKENEGRLRDAGLGLPHGVPSRQCLDRVFREDDCRSRADNAAENLATFRHLLVGVLQQKGKELGLSVGGVAFKGVCSREFAFSLVFGDAA